MAADNLTVRADGVEVARLYGLSAKTIALHTDESWSPTERRMVARANHRGNVYQVPMTLRGRLAEILDNEERAEAVYAKCAGAREVTITDDYHY